MKFISIIIFTIISFVATAQTTHLQWTAKNVTAGAQGNQTITSATDAQGNTFEIQETQDANSFYITNRFICYDNTGYKKWEFVNDSCFSTCAEKYNCILPQGSGAAIFIGYGKLKKINGNGNFVWQHSYSNANVVKPIQAMFDNNGEVVVAFDVDGITTGNDFSVAKFSKFNGSEIWWTTIPDAGANGDILYETITGIDIDKNNSIYAIGTAGNTFANIARLMLSKIDSSGLINYSEIIENSFINFNGAGNSKLKIDKLAFVYTAYDLGGAVILKKFADTNASLKYTKVLKKDSAFTMLADLNYVHDKLYLLNNFTYKIADSSFQGFFETNKKYYVEKIDTAFNTFWQKFYLKNFDINAAQNGFGGALQMIACDNKFSISSTMNKTISQPFLLINRIDSSGTMLWYDSIALDMMPNATLSNDVDCNTYLTYSNFDAGFGLKAITKKFTDALNFPQSIVSQDINKHFEVYYHSNGFSIFSEEKKLNHLQLFTLDGKVILEKNTVINNKFINTQHLSNGIYILRLQLDGIPVTRKFCLK